MGEREEKEGGLGAGGRGVEGRKRGVEEWGRRESLTWRVARAEYVEK